MTQCLFICDVNLLMEEGLSILLVKEYDLKTHIKGFHAYMTKWTPKNGEIFKAQPEPENGRSARFAETVSYYLRASNENCCGVEATGKRVNLGNGEGLQIPCILHFYGKAKSVRKLKDILPQLM